MEKKKRSNREYGAYLARQFFNGQIVQYNILDSFPDYSKDAKLKLLYKLIITRPKKKKFFVFDNSKKYNQHILKAYNLIEEIEMSIKK